VAAAFRRERFWGVRAEWAEALGKGSSEAALRALLTVVADEDAARVVGALLTALGRYRDARVVDAVVAKLGSGLGPRARAAAYEALGKQRENAPFERLVTASKEPGWGGFAQAGALRGLAETRRPEAVEVLVDRARDADPRARGTACEALGALARRLRDRPRERAVEALVDLLRAPDLRQRKGAARGLVEARAKEAVGALEAYRATLTEQDAVLLDRGIRELRRSEDGTQTERRIEDLEAALRKLGERVDELEGRHRS